MKIAIDIDEVLSKLLEKVLEHYNRIYNTNLTQDKCPSYRWNDYFGISQEKTLDIYQDFVNLGKLRDLDVIPGAIEGIKKIKNNNKLMIVTSRGVCLQTDTENWLDKYFPKLFDDIYYLREDLYDPLLKSKFQACQEINAGYFIEDDIDHLNDFRGTKTKVLIYDHPWNKNFEAKDNFSRMHSWEQIADTINK